MWKRIYNTMISVAASAILLMEPINYLIQSRPGPFSSLNQLANIIWFENITCTEYSSWNFFFLQHWENDSLRCLVSSLPAAVDSTPFCRLHAVDKTAPVTCKHSAFPEKLQRNFIVYPNSMYWLDGLRTLEYSGTDAGCFFLSSPVQTTDNDNHPLNTVASSLHNEGVFKVLRTN
jgi:hypothetical protein